MQHISELQAQIAELTRERDILKARIEPLRARIRALSDEVVKLRPLAEIAAAPAQERDPKRIVAAAQALAREIIAQAKKDARAEAKQIIREARERERAKKQAKREAERAKREAEKAEREEMLARRPEMVSFTYLNADFVLTERTVEITSAYEDHGGMYIRAFCHLRAARRTFRLDRIRGDVVNVLTGEVMTWYELGRLWGLGP